MAKVGPARGPKDTGPGLRRSERIAKERDKKKHKIVLEGVSKDQNQLRSVITFAAEPPAGYTFIPAGNPELTAALKEFARRENRRIFAVTTTPHATRHELSREVHRVGFHFPTVIVDQVCAHYGIRLSSSGRLIDENKNNNKSLMRVYQKGQLVLDEKIQDQVTINTDAKQTIKDLFPNIPDKDLFQIIKTAFQLGQGKVGTAKEIPLVRRAQLAVVAHVRHIYTDYDKLLRQVPYTEARHRVERETLLKLVEWRGDDQKEGASKNAVDDIVREVIYISDDEDSDDDVQEMERLDHDTVQIQEISPPAPAMNGLHQPSMYTLDEPEAPTGYRYAFEPRRSHRTDYDVAASRDRRFAVWDSVREDYRTGRALPPSQLTRVEDRAARFPHHNDQFPSSNISIPEPLPAPRQPPLRSVVDYVTNGRDAPGTIVRAADGRIYEAIRSPLDDQPYAHRNARRMPSPPERRVYSQNSRLPPATHYRTHSYNESSGGTIMPSIEEPSNSRGNASYPSNPQTGFPRSLPGGREESRAHEPVLIEIADSPEQRFKRRRIATPPLSDNRRTSRGYYAIPDNESQPRSRAAYTSIDESRSAENGGHAYRSASHYRKAEEIPLVSLDSARPPRLHEEMHSAFQMNQPAREIIDLSASSPRKNHLLVQRQPQVSTPRQIYLEEPRQILLIDDHPNARVARQPEQTGFDRARYTTYRMTAGSSAESSDRLRVHNPHESDRRQDFVDVRTGETVSRLPLPEEQQQLVRERREYLPMDAVYAPQSSVVIRDTLEERDPRYAHDRSYIPHDNRGQVEHSR